MAASPRFVAVIVNEPDPHTVEDTTTASAGIDEVSADAELANADTKASDASPTINDRCSVCAVVIPLRSKLGANLRQPHAARKAQRSVADVTSQSRSSFAMSAT